MVRRERQLFGADEEKTKVDLTAALRWLNSAVISSTGNKLREPERVILKGTWRGLTYEQMADGSEYSTNYLMRDVAPKLWKQLSNVFGRSVGKTNFRVALEAYAAANSTVSSELLGLDASAGFAAEDSVPDESTRGLSAMARNAMRPEERAGGYWPDRMAQRLSGAEVGEQLLEGQARFDLVEEMPSRKILPSRFKAPLYGYESERSRMKSWLSQREVGEATARIIGVWGLTGVGKSMLAERLVSETTESFDRIVVRSLQDKPTLSDLCGSILAELGFSSQKVGRIPNQPSQTISYLLAVMARQSVLLLLEDVEAILDPQQLAGSYLSGYQNYEDFFASAAGTDGCIVVTGIEGPAGLVRQGDALEDNQAYWMRSLFLHGLDLAAANELLQQESLSSQPSSVAAWEELIERYQGHPLAIKAAARVIREIFDGRVDEFLAQMSVLFTDVLRLLEPSFNRLSKAERDILYWLASQDKPLSLAELRSTLPVPLSPSELISALDSLKQRSLLIVKRYSQAPSESSETSQTSRDASPPTFSLPTMVKAYAIYQFVGQFGSRIGASVSGTKHYRFLEQPAIALGAQPRSPVRLSQWFEGRFDTRWQPLENLFSAVERPAVRLRSAYRFQDETFVKRCKSVVLSVPDVASGGRSVKNKKRSSSADTASAVLIVAIHQDGENLYKICVQAQPSTDETILPETMELRLLDAQETVLASVTAQQADSFIQLPYFQGAVDESFEIELALEAAVYRERFEI